MRNLNYDTIVYNNGIYGIKSSLRHTIHDKTMECIRRKRMSSSRRRISKTELIFKLSLILSILSLIAAFWIS